MKANTIDWDGFKDTYNKINKTDYKTVEEWISALYNKHNKFVSPLAIELGISFGTTKKYLAQWGLLERKPKGGNNYKNRPFGKKEQIFLKIPKETMKDLTRDQICERCGLSKDWTNVLIRKHKRACRRVYNER